MNGIDRTIEQLAQDYRSGIGLPQGAYLDPDIYQAELDRIWRHDWILAAHSCELPSVGDYRVLEFDHESIIIARQNDGTVKAFHNVCRHRGIRLLNRERGCARSFVCPYHQWVYSVNGELMSCRGMAESTAKSELGLLECHVVELFGLVFVSLAERTSEFRSAEALLGPMLQPQGLVRAKVAKSIDYEIQANWKIVWENNRECYHCAVNHPEYIRANFDLYEKDQQYGETERALSAAVARIQSNLHESGIQVTHDRLGLAEFPDPSGRLWFSANRTPTVEGYVTESLDGKQVAPLMGDYQLPDVGTLRIRTMPNFWNHSSCDHSVSTQLLPAGIDKTIARVSWLVDQQAEESADYSLDKLLPFWQSTSEQDWQLCEEVQRGIQSSGYRPGPLSKRYEYNVDAFHRWYFNKLSRHTD